MNDKVGILIPIYNTGDNLEKCLESVINQSYHKLEIILVDDGSDDNTPDICDKFAKKDSRIKVFHTNNNGVACARNFAINNCKSKYITFVDSDDYIDEDYIETLYKLQKKYNADIVSCDLEFCYDYNQRLKKGNKKPRVLTNEEAMVKIMYGKEISNGPTCKLFKKELFKDIEFPKEMIYEDLCIMYKIIAKTNIVVTIPDKKYYYYQRRDSITHQNFSEKKLFILTIVREIEIYMTKEYPKLIKPMKYMILSRCLDVASIIPLFDKKYKKERLIVWKNIKTHRKIVFFDNNTNSYIKILIMFSLFGIIGIQFGRKCINTIKKCKSIINK